jgi:hypothetical protein
VSDKVVRIDLTSHRVTAVPDSFVRPVLFHFSVQHFSVDASSSYFPSVLYISGLLSRFGETNHRRIHRQKNGGQKNEEREKRTVTERNESGNDQ